MAVEFINSMTAQATKGSAVPRKANDVDAELEEMLTQQKATIKVVGCGGGGNNTISRISEVGIMGSETIAINTDAQDLLYTNAERKILIGKERTKGHGAGADPRVGEESARETESLIKQALEKSDMVFITCGLGGGTGTGSAPVVADIAKRQGALTVAVVTMPFSMEGNRRYENALNGLKRLEQIVDTLIVVPNDKLLELAPDLPLQTAFKVADEILTNAVKGIAELVTRAGLVNLDFADIRAVMSGGGVALIGVGESDSTNRALEAVDKAMNNPLVAVDITGSTGALINIAGSKDFTLNEAKTVVEMISSKMSPDAKIIWGAQIYEDLARTLRVTLVITGVKGQQMLGKRGQKIAEQMQDMNSPDLGIEFIGG